ncbi:MAG: transposase [Candidatus Omnitrophota bacterium]
MPRIKRDIVDGGIYHILNRGHNKDKIFAAPEDYNTFKKIIERYKERFFFDLYHYCIMPNHFHLLIKIANAEDMSRLMKGVCQSYANYYKMKYEHIGYLFQNRYKSILIDDDSYLLECARYIERNPVRAEIVEIISDYRWSSYNYYASGFCDSLITADPLFGTLADSTTTRRSSYVEYVSKPRPYEAIVDEKLSSFK